MSGTRAEEDDATILRRYGIEPDPVIEAYKKDVDRTLLRENLRRTPEQRLNTLIALQAFAAEIRRAGRAAGLHDRTDDGARSRQDDD